MHLCDISVYEWVESERTLASCLLCSNLRAGLLQSLYRDLHQLAPKWLTFGVHLGVPYDRLKGLQEEDSMVDRCFIDVLGTWLNGEDATVENLVEALRCPGVDQKRLAKEIEGDKHSEFEHKYMLHVIIILSELALSQARGRD